MKSVAEFFKNRVVISIIGLIVLSLLIWFVGPSIKFGDSNYAPLGGQITRLVLIMVLLVLWGLNNLRLQRKDKKSNEELVKDLAVNQSSSSGGILSEQASEEMHQIGERFSDALSVLKKFKFKGMGFRKGLYELPWYIIIGPPGSGKTTALVNSSLDFPLAEKFGKGALRGVGGTRNCDWWFTNEAVLIDTAGRYTTQDSHKVVDSAAWEGFLGLLKKHRRRRPINGAIVAISLQDILSQTEEERMMHARTIRSRIDELMDKLEIRFPIYLIFTKSDLVSGFSEFFEDLGREEREQVWGISLPNAPHAAQSPEFEYIEDEYRKLVRRLYERIIGRTHEERDIKRRGAIQGFPQQMDNLGKVVQHFVQQTFLKNRYRYQPYLRGVYFTSGVQDGTPIDRLMSAVSANFGFDRQVVQSGLQQGKSFFLGQLFKSIIFPESELVGSNRSYELFIKWGQRAAYLGMVGLTVLMFVIWSGGYAVNESYMKDVGKYIAEYNAEKKRISSWSDDLRSPVPALNALAKASVVYDQQAHPWLSSLGMYDGRVDAAAEKAYLGQLRILLLPRLLKYMEGSLKQADQGTDIYNNFRTYLMFNKIKHFDAKLIAGWFAASWDKKLAGQADVKRELLTHLQVLLQEEPEPAPLNQDLVRSVRLDLLRVPVPQRIYSSIRSDSKFTQNVNLMEDIGDSAKNIYVFNDQVNQKLTVPFLYTKQGYDTVDMSSSSEMIASIAKEKWVLTDDENSNVDFIKYDPKEIADRVKELYLADYRAYWLGYYNALEIRPFQNIQQVNEVLISLTDPVRSPMINVLQVGSKNTQLTNQLISNLAEGGNKETKDPKDEAKAKLTGMLVAQVETPVDKQFHDLNRFMRDSGGKSTDITSTIQKLRQLQEFVNEIAIAPEPGKKSLEVARARYQGGGSNAINKFSNDVKSLPEPVNRWLTTLSNDTWRILLQSAHSGVSSEWRAQVYEPFQRGLAGRYPLNPNAQDEVAINDFTEFFKPGGTIDKFSAEYVKPFVDVNHGWSNRGIDNYSIGLSAQAIAQLKKANEIKTVFFSENQSMPSVTFQLRPYDMKKSDARFQLELGEKRLTYSHGPKFWETVTWAGNDQFNRVRILFEDLNEQQYATTYEGPWAWFRLQDRSRMSQTGSASVYLVTYAINTNPQRDGGSLAAADKSNHSIQYEIKAKSVINPFNKDLLGTFKIPEGI
ncbi:MAG: type VI secretion system membrane subunit TssM [Gammaproteobacteria bacterium]|nr:type VI secretion system membrane subunit TssM [Gammaproteobacteria bacterium]